MDERPRALREHLVFLNDATAKIGASPDLEETVQGLARAAVPFLADLATVHLLEDLLFPEFPGTGPGRGQEPEVGALRRMAVAHDEELASLFHRRLWRAHQVLGPPGSAMTRHHPVQPFSVGPRSPRPGI